MVLGRDVFLALAAVIWADGRVVPSEAKAIADAARACGLSGDDLTAVVGATLERTELPTSLKLTHDEQLFVYGIAVWLAEVDGVVTHEETAVVSKIGDMFALSVEERAMVWAAARASTPEGMKRDVNALAEAITRAANES